jgi:4-nitrophenyl phosphatase
MDRSAEPLLRLVIFDLDGVIYRGRQPVPGAAALVAMLRKEGLLVRFATNNSMATRAMYVPRLVEMGVPVQLYEIVTSTSATIDHLRAHLPEVRTVMAVGAPGMLDELRTAGFDATAAGDAVDGSYDGGPLDASYDAVIAGLDPSFDFRRLAAASTAIRGGARFVATNADLRYPTPTGFLPGAGSIIAALSAASGAEPLIIGKPEPGIFRAILERAGVRPSEAVAIGDNPDADVVAAHRAGMRSVLVLTGVADAALAATLEGERRPDHVASDPSEAAGLLRQWLS